MDQKSPYSECEPNITNKEILKVELLQSLSKAALIIFDGSKLQKNKKQTKWLRLQLLHYQVQHKSEQKSFYRVWSNYHAYQQYKKTYLNSI